MDGMDEMDEMDDMDAAWPGGRSPPMDRGRKDRPYGILTAN